jgi:hypothetical protein
MSDAAAPPPAPAPKRAYILGLVAILAGLGFAWLAWSEVDEIRSLARDGVRAEATVTGMEEHRSRKGGSTFYPIYVWRTPEGRVVRERSAASVTREAYPSGRRVQVVYDPVNTASVRSVDSLDEGAGAPPWIAGVLSLLCFALAFGALYRSRSPARKQGLIGPR